MMNNEVYVLFATNVWKERPASIYAICRTPMSLQRAILRGLEENAFEWDDHYGYEPEDNLTTFEWNQCLQYGLVEVVEVED